MTQAVGYSAERGSAQLRDDLLRFERGDIDPAGFNHEAHIRMAFAMSMHYAFDAALARFATALRLMCSRQGTPEKYNMTITAAFLSLVAERCAAKPDVTWAEFAATHRDLLDRRCLEKWYDKALLASELARRTFILPRPVGVVSKPPGSVETFRPLGSAADSGPATPEPSTSPFQPSVVSRLTSARPLRRQRTCTRQGWQQTLQSST